MANTININDAAQVVMDAETAALSAIKTILDEADAKLGEVEASLPSTLTLDACRILNEVRSSFAYRRNSDIPTILNRYAAPVVVNYNPDPA
jgi:hypothetical protein